MQKTRSIIRNNVEKNFKRRIIVVPPFLFEYFIDYTYIMNLRFFSNEEKLYEEKGFDMPETIFYISEY
jgi:hypothetical protein